MNKLLLEHRQEKTYIYIIKNVTQLSHSIFKINLKPMFDYFRHIAGHYCQLLCPDGKFRSYSITNHPNKNGALELHIRIRDQTNIKQMIMLGKTIEVKGPYGKCIHNQNSDEPTIFLAEGIGITAFYSIINNKRYFVKNCLLLWTRQEEDHDYAYIQIKNWIKRIKNIEIYAFDTSKSFLTDILYYCNDFLIKNKKIKFYLAGSSNLSKYIIDNFVFNNKESVNFFCDI
jgi:NAD(P)H-flavin reductase